jgi:hypothetical protein
MVAQGEKNRKRRREFLILGSRSFLPEEEREGKGEARVERG